MSRTSKFQFVDNVDHWAATTAGVVEVPSGITSKQQLMQELARLTPLPNLFGSNWDAVDECLRDRLLSEPRQPLCLLHRDLPLAQHELDCGDYLALLDDTLCWAEETANCEFTVVFPVDAASAIARNEDT